jgi:hypothetical protein
MKGRTRDRTMREHPDIEQRKRQAKELLTLCSPEGPML